MYKKVINRTDRLYTLLDICVRIHTSTCNVSTDEEQTDPRIQHFDDFSCGMYYYYNVFVLLKVFWCPCMAMNASVHYNGGLLPDIILLTQCY